MLTLLFLACVLAAVLFAFLGLAELTIGRPIAAARMLGLCVMLAFSSVLLFKILNQ